MCSPSCSSRDLVLHIYRVLTTRLFYPIQFFSSLSSLLSTVSHGSRGSVYLTQKQLPSLSSSPPQDDASSSRQYEQQQRQQPQPASILIRATDGRTSNPDNRKSDSERRQGPKAKISTIVSPDGLETFYARYAEVCKAGMVGLKKRDRSAKKKGKTKGKGLAAKVTKG
jgi:signal recognition particle subunit SRP14